MGTTALDRATFLEYVEQMKEVYSADKYHLLDFNCGYSCLGFQGRYADRPMSQATRSRTTCWAS